MKEKINKEPFDRKQKPVKQNIFFMPFLWLYCLAVTKKANLKIKKVNIEGLKPPYILIGTHHAFMDFCVTPMAVFPHRANYISELEGFEAYGEWLYRQIGCLCKRKFTNDFSLIKNIKYVVDKKGIIVIYPEARYCNMGTNSKLPQSVGKLAKMLKVPVVVLNMRGNYLQSPIWNPTPRTVRLEATMTQIFTTEELKQASVDEVNEKIQQYFVYDEYKWQYENKIAITYEKRAEGIEKALYQCPHCKAEYEMQTEGKYIYCMKCGKKWGMTEYGRMKSVDGEDEFPHIPDWYEFQRKEVIKEIDEGAYKLEAPVRIEALPNAKNFINLGNGYLKHGLDGFHLTLDENHEHKTLHFSPSEMTSVHTEYDYRGKGQCITLSTLENTYFLFPLCTEFNATKIQFATEYLYEMSYENGRGTKTWK